MRENKGSVRVDGVESESFGLKSVKRNNSIESFWLVLRKARVKVVRVGWMKKDWVSSQGKSHKVTGSIKEEWWMYKVE
jgi:hypothetical protein